MSEIAVQPGIRHLYVHLPFCSHRCGYCDFVTVVGRGEQHGAYVDALLPELERERGVLGEPFATVFLGGGTPSFTEPRRCGACSRRFLPRGRGDRRGESGDGHARAGGTPARRRRHPGLARRPDLRAAAADVLERVAGPDDVRRAVHTLRDASFDNISLDLIYGIPGQEPSDLDRDLAEALALAPEHLSLYELEAKPGTRFTHAWGDELVRQSEAMEGYFERVVETLTAAGYRWYETANFCLAGERAGGRDLRAHHNLGHLARARLPRRRDRGSLDARSGATPERRLDRPLHGRPCGRATIRRASSSSSTRERRRRSGSCSASASTSRCRSPGSRMSSTALRSGGWWRAVSRSSDRRPASEETLTLTPRGRFLGDAVTAELLG